MNFIDRVKNILISPKTEWDIVNAELATPQSLLTTYVLPLAVVAAIGPLLTGFFLQEYLGLRSF